MDHAAGIALLFVRNANTPEGPMTPHDPLDAVTGAFSYTGASITDELIRRGLRVRTLTGPPERPASGTPVEIRPLGFAERAALRQSFEGVDTLYNTYWVRFTRGSTTFDTAVDNSRRLFAAAADAGVRRIVHVSMTQPGTASPYPYFRGKAVIEDQLYGTGISHAIARPAFLFGRDGVLINNVAWMLRHLPVVAVGDCGGYWVRGIHVDDLATLCADLGEQDTNVTVDAVGPERMTFRTLIGHVRDAVAPTTPIVSVPGWACHPLPQRSVSSCATGSSPQMSTTPWLTDWPTPKPPPTDRPGSPTGSPPTPKASAAATSTTPRATSPQPNPPPPASDGND